MQGFFTRTEAVVPYKSEKGTHSCVSCGLYKTSSHPRMAEYGKGKKGIMLIGEAVTPEDDKTGRPWSDPAGRLLIETCKGLGLDVEQDCITVNALSCVPQGKPTEHQMACCRQRLLGVVKRLKPKVIVLLGDMAVRSLISHKWTRSFGDINKWQGWTIPDRGYGAWLCPTYSPAHVLAEGKGNETAVIWKNDIKRAIACVSKAFPYKADERSLITVTDDIEGVLTTLIKDKPELMAFDIEATGLKPYDAGHEIVAISFCHEDDHAYAIPFPKTSKELKLLTRLLEHPKIGKIAANMSYEDNWLTVLHGIGVKPWAFDTMQAAHILDNRPGITGLKFQGYVRLGQLGYADPIAPYLTAKDTNSKNRVKELEGDSKMFNELLVYCGIDSLLEYRLARIQMKELGL